MRYDPDKKPAVRLAFAMPDGEVLMRDWLWEDRNSESFAAIFDWTKGEVPAWLRDPLRTWTDPQDPVTFSGFVIDGHEADALGVLAL